MNSLAGTFWNMAESPLRRVLTFISFMTFALLSPNTLMAGNDENVFPGADRNTPSKAYYFDWLSSQYEGSNETQELTYMDFFKWLHDEYGMVLDVFSLDVGNIDDGPYTAGVGALIPYHYGSLSSVEFKRQFPHGFEPLVKKAAAFGARLGIWLGPDGFGNTPEEARQRSDLLIKFCRDYHFIMFKMDAVAGPLRPEKQDVLIKTLEECRKYTPDLIVLNERVDFGKAAPYITTKLWKGAETYIGVFMNNTETAPHHRAGSISRSLTPGLSRMYEDHGVCFNSYLDYWEDDVVLQAFNRSLLMAPEIYGTPWLLRDNEYSKLARFFNLHRRFDKVLVHGTPLPENQYGPYAVSRGDGSIRFLTLRNLTWNTKTYEIDLNGTIGLEKAASVEVRRLNPSERILGDFKWGDAVNLGVLPFRADLIQVSTKNPREVGIRGADYEVVRDVPGKPVVIDVLGMPGTDATIRVEPGNRRFRRAELDGGQEDDLCRGGELRITFPGDPLTMPWHRKIGDLKPVSVPADSESLYEATCYAADNNALEVRALKRSGPSSIPQVNAARKSFFEDPMFINRGIWDKYLFDGNMDTFFIARLDHRSLRVDFGEPSTMDKIIIRIRPRVEYDLNPVMNSFDDDARAEVSADLQNWMPIDIGTRGKGTLAIARIPPDLRFRYLRIHGAPQRIAEIEGYSGGKMLDRSKWSASNLFQSYSEKAAVAAWSYSYVPKEIPPHSKLAVALNGRHGNEGAYAALRVNGRPVGAPDRSVPFPSNTWEYYNTESDSNYTYYFPLDKSMVSKKVDVVVLVLKGGSNEITPEVWLTTYPVPYVSRRLVLTE